MIEVNKKYGCLTVLDMGEEYRETEKYCSLLKEKINNKDVESKLSTHYKCRCKCGKINYYNAETIENEPRYCFYPVPVSTRHTYSVAAANATYYKREKYAKLENVILLDKSKCIPSDDYCENYNKYKAKQLFKKEEKIAELPRYYAKNYDVDYAGRYYESLYIVECCNEHLESKPTYSFNSQHRKIWHSIKVYKQYKCKCVICGKEQIIDCDKFGIYPPTDYGYHAYYGYWSNVLCDCHSISSFQWIVNKLLFESDIPYQVEYSFSDLRGILYKLRFDFAVFNDDGSLKCLIECQGEQHYEAVEEFGGERQFKSQVNNDDKKRDYCKKHNIQLIEISYKDKKYEKIEKILRENKILK